ncbi:MAG: nitroreductase family protein [Xanthobacteraceae bacterium]|nr:nitroreductase family protein [Xanthobacteraceae bacterium]MBX3533446.1 nitroreductase family protein [Xanthobacteraceae bacterium]MCW5676386.1 nitroreductase family protein [Xanthobacteraceae bacterium]
MNLMEAVKARRSIRRYHATSINDDQLECLLSAAQWAPSAHNRQPWRFTPLRSLSAKEALADAMGGKLRADRRKDGDDERIISADVQRSRARIVEAPLVIVVSMSLSDMDQYKDELRSNAEKVMAIQSTAMAVQNILLAATSIGLGACWMCAPLFCPDIVRSTLGLPADWEAQALVTVGAPANEGKPALRKPIALMTHTAD